MTAVPDSKRVRNALAVVHYLESDTRGMHQMTRAQAAAEAITNLNEIESTLLLDALKLRRSDLP